MALGFVLKRLGHGAVIATITAVFAGQFVSAQTCMTQSLLMDTEPGQAEANTTWKISSKLDENTINIDQPLEKLVSQAKSGQSPRPIVVPTSKETNASQTVKGPVAATAIKAQK